jgi:processive 1,2-diacylglycerol beta-glucosyltransferase
VLVSKAGGLTLAEAFCSRAPVVIHDVLAGQETGNLEYVLQHEAVAYACEPAALVRIVAELLDNTAARARLAECGARLARPDAARDIATRILARLDEGGR